MVIFFKKIEKKVRMLYILFFNMYKNEIFCEKDSLFNYGY